MLYTGAGDDGMTKTFDCNQQKISKSSEVPEALGALDELNAFLGFVKVRAAGESRLPAQAGIANALREAQENLFCIQAEVAGADKHLAHEAVGKMEKIIGEIEREIPPIAGFSISGGTELSALLDVARTLARRAERRLIAVRMMDKSDLSKLSNETVAYMNRLSSLLFALARFANHLAGVTEESPHY